MKELRRKIQGLMHCEIDLLLIQKVINQNDRKCQNSLHPR